MPRLSKRQQRELEELQQLETGQVANEPAQDVPETAEEEETTDVAQGTSKFDLLMGDEDDKEESEEEATQAAGKKSKKKKKKKKPTPTVSTQSGSASKTTSQTKSKVAAGKAGKDKSGKDEIDLALEELAEKLPHLRTSGKAAQHASEGPASATSRALFSLLGASLKDFDSEAEMRRFFGSKVALVLGSAPAHLVSRSLSRRGIPRTAFEFARLLFALDPIGDPHGAAFYLDYLSAKGGMGQWLLDVWDVWPEARKEIADNPLASHGINIHCIPGWSYTRALILYDQEVKKRGATHDVSTAALREAIIAFPEVIPYLVDKAGVNLSGNVRAHDSLRITTQYTHDDPAGSSLHMLGHLYALRANSLWKNEPHSVWLASTVASVENQLGTENSVRKDALKHFAQGPSEAMARHAIVADLRAISAYCRPGTFPPVTHAYDPLSPSTSLTYYDETYFQDVPKGQPSARTTPQGQQHMPGEFGDEDEDAVDLENIDPQILLNHFLDQAQGNGNARIDPGLWQRIMAHFGGPGGPGPEVEEQ
ncbi:Transcription factor 25 Short=TCF-25 [Rhizoctonia solani AG-1 IB]|uniref:Transcription factor 25 Short=TCF-25 n=1 Tax=Thanatephorus cucumeris (strain AG1-IB / isolate 7/3/14) TaxID=1108050 RepID=M5BLA8_THACB|nr:Transcription factor 25 Short=TCF-25 [Rhizoctonia solani AG-1 IB]